MTACRREAAAACWVSSPILTTRRSAPGARSPATPGRVPRSWWYRRPAARRARSATPRPVTGVTIAAVREAELRLACERLGVTRVRCLDHVDGTLADAGFSALVDEVTEIIREFRPDIVITFGPDGGYGHPDHVTISAVTTAACQRAAGRGTARTGRPPGPCAAAPAVLPALPAGRPADHRAAGGLADQPPDRFAGTAAFGHALLLLAEAARTMGHIRDHVQVRWYPPGSYVVEQGEAAAELFSILSGEAETWQQTNGGRRERLGRLRGGGVLRRARHREAPAPQLRAWSPPPASPAWSCPRHRQPSSPAGAREPAWPVPCPPRRRTRCRRPGARGQVRASSAATCPGRSNARSKPFPPTAASSRWSRTCSRSSCCGRCSAGSTSWPPLPAGPLTWTRCRGGPCLSQR